MSATERSRTGSDFWDERYRGKEFAYGSAPNRWLEAQAGAIEPGGRVLCLGEGEGRNAVWLAERGFSVDAVDASPVGLEKARRLAAERGVRIRTQVDDLATYRPDPSAYDALVLVYVHMPPVIRAAVHAAGAAALKAGGIVIIEAFAPRQLGRESGGPPRLEMLFDTADVRADFPRVDWYVLEEAEIDLDEGTFHRGPAAVVRGVGRAGNARGP